MAISTKTARSLLKSTGEILKNSAADLLSSSDFISRTIGMNNSYEDIMLLVQALGRQPVSLLGKDYLYIFDHVRRNYQQGTTISSTMYGSGGNYWCPKFTFYKEKPTVKFADVYNDPLNLLDRWMPDFIPNITKSENTNKFYAESNDGSTNNKVISGVESNMGTATGQLSTSFQNLDSCDLIKKTNENFRHGKYNTLVARFHTNTTESMDTENPTQTAISKSFGMSHGRNLLKLTPDSPNGYNNPYCRVWTYHHQYHRMLDAIRPFGDVHSAKELESMEEVENGVGFRTFESKNYGIKGGSERLDTHGVLNYDNGFVNIAPTAKIKDYFEHKQDDKDRKSVSTKRCMFSIENLAWRDEKMKYDQFEAYGLSAEQRGPLGGRIMWFPPYDISFSENVSVKWNSNEFIGRGENIYTYTNTERRGNLSFTLLIDHPSILDYWTGHERNGMKNQGMTLLPGNTDGVDGKDNQEQTLLRFFAGCDILTAKPQEYWMRENTPQNTKEDPSKTNVPQPDPQKPDEAKPPTPHTICCVLYFPNNYSGVDDLPFGNNPQVNAVHYLMNGIGAQKAVDPNTKDAVDIPTTISVAPSGNGANHGGYEINGNISITNEALQSNTNTRQRTYADTKSSAKKAQYLTDKNATKYTVTYGNNPYTLAKIVGSEAMSYSQANAKLWYRKRWYYRVDKTYENDKLSKETSYIDTQSFNLNGGEYNKVRTTSGSIKIPQEGGTSGFHLISFASLFNALEGVDNKVVTSTTDVNKSDVELVKKIIDYKNNGIKIKSIKFRGHASSAGYGSSNATLSDNRAKTFKAWMMSKGFPKPSDGSEPEVLDSIRQDGAHNNVDNGDANSLLAKIWRSASVMIEYEESNTDKAASQDSKVQTDGNGKPVTSDTRIDTNTGKEVSTAPYMLNTTDILSSKTLGATPFINKDQDAVNWLYTTDDGKRIRERGVPEVIRTRDSNGFIVEHTTFVPVNEANFTKADIERLTGKNYFNTAATNYDDSYQNTGINVKNSTVKRYDNEGEFFELLDKKSPFLHHLITDKIKYFDPAYHSISPEGFNARLTFLHQCTRQGATIGNSDPDVQTAYNLAFGRPPVCVLRIGDFYYTKIIINSMTINYDDPQWDLNPEGIGVMPMFAKVNLDFTFIGGSDLAGPIARLQNAVSFNYYANTSVYDNRAERVEYDPTGTGKEVKYKPFNYPNGPGRNVASIEMTIGDTTFKTNKTEDDWEDV